MLGVPLVAGRLGLAGPEPHRRGADPPRGAQPGRGARAGAAADRQRDQGHARGPARLLHVPAPGVRPDGAGAGGADLAPRRRVRLLGRRARPAPAVAARDGRRRTCSRASRASSRPRTSWPSPSRSRRARRSWSASTGARAELVGHTELQRLCLERWRARGGRRRRRSREAIPTGGPLEGQDVPGYTSAGPSEPVKVEDRVLGGFGWQREDMKLVQQMAATGAEPIGSLGYDGPLACLSPERQNLADFFKESVAVVTNPAIDREREVEHFSCRAVFGPRPPLGRVPGERDDDRDRLRGDPRRPRRAGAARRLGLPRGRPRAQDLPARGPLGGVPRPRSRDRPLLPRVGGDPRRDRAAQAGGHRGGARRRAELLVLSDRTVYEGDRRYLDPHLALAAVDLALREHLVEPGEVNLRRRCGIVLRSAALRNVHDTVLALGLGADGVCPYTMVEVGLMDDYRTDVSNLCAALRKGIEKVISTIGIHEVRGYARLFSCIGLKPELTAIFDTPAYFGSERGGTGFAELDRDGDERRRVLAGRRRGQARQDVPLLPEGLQGGGGGLERVSGSYEDYSLRVRELEAEQPVSLRHLLELRPDGPPGAARERRGRPALLPDRDLLDELRLPGRGGLPLVRRGGQADQHRRDERRGRRDPGPVRALPALARPAGRVRPLRGDRRDDQLVVPGRDQDRPGGEAGRGRAPAGAQGDGEGRAGAQRDGRART